MSSSNKETLLEYLYENVDKLSDRTFLTQPMGGGDANVKTFTFQETLDEAKKMAGYIESLKLEPKSQIAICSKNCAWWIIADLAIWMSGHVSVPVRTFVYCFVLFCFEEWIALVRVRPECIPMFHGNKFCSSHDVPTFDYQTIQQQQ